MAVTIAPGLERRLKAEITGDVLFSRFDRGRYATDASRQSGDAGRCRCAALDGRRRARNRVAQQEGISVLPRGGGTSQAGQTVNSSLVIDCSRNLNRVLDLDVAGRRCVVEPGMVLDELNRELKPHGLWFPVDISTASRATIGGMVGNNSCGARSLRYGNTRENVLSIDAMLADGTAAHFGPVANDLSDAPTALRPLAADLLAIGAREADEVAARFPRVQRRVGGYNLDALVPGRNDLNLAHILVGSEGTLAFSTRIELKLSPLLGRRALGACHFGSFHAAMEAAQHIVKLNPIAVELVDETMIELARDIALFRPTIAAFVRGDPAAVLLVEFAEPEWDENLRRLAQLRDLIGDLGFAWNRPGAHRGGVVDVLDPKLQSAITEVRTAGLNIMMSMKEGGGKPVSFVEDCAVPLEHLADYTQRLIDVFEQHGTRGTWYAHASVGCLHVRPVLNLRLEKDVNTMRAIAEAAFAFVREYKGSHSGEHGDGIVRSEFHQAMFGPRLVRAFEAVKDRFDPAGVFNPGKIVRAPKFDDRSYLRYAPDYHGEAIATRLDWSAYPGTGGGFRAPSRCATTTAPAALCRRRYVSELPRRPAKEKDVTRGRANTLRLAVTGQLGPHALTSDAMAETLKLCVSCKACRRECPTGVDMARMKIEVLATRAEQHGLSLRDRLVAYLPRYARYAAHLSWLLNLRDTVPGAAKLSEATTGFSARRSLPRWRSDWFRDPDDRDVDAGHKVGQGGKEVVVFADTFNRYFEPENLDAALGVLRAAGYRIHVAAPRGGSRPLCCGRTFLAVGKLDEARREAERVLAAVKRFVDRGIPVVGLEPSCMLGFRDEIPALVKNDAARRLARHAVLFEEFLATESQAGRLDLPLAPIAPRALLHGHCHQKSFDTMGAVETVLRLVPGLEVETIESSCCGMAGSFGFNADTIDISLAMGELTLLPAVRKAPDDAIIVADGTSCRHQIHDGARRQALHVAQVLNQSIAARLNADGQCDRPRIANPD
jgi:FAD/FMN-containing dehydrogenase/Fe-S oxidoreductase